jgi:hypothetical protein
VAQLLLVRLGASKRRRRGVRIGAEGRSSNAHQAWPCDRRRYGAAERGR